MLLSTAILLLVLLFFCRAELGLRGIALTLAAWIGAAAVFYFAGFEPILFTIPQVILCIILILVIFKGDIRL